MVNPFHSKVSQFDWILLKIGYDDKDDNVFSWYIYVDNSLETPITSVFSDIVGLHPFFWVPISKVSWINLPISMQIKSPHPNKR